MFDRRWSAGGAIYCVNATIASVDGELHSRSPWRSFPDHASIR